MTYDSRACQSFVMALLKTDGALTDDGVLQDHVPQVRRLLEQHGHIPFHVNPCHPNLDHGPPLIQPMPPLNLGSHPPGDRGRPRQHILAGSTTSLSPGSSAWRTAPGFSVALTAPRYGPRHSRSQGSQPRPTSIELSIFHHQPCGALSLPCHPIFQCWPSWFRRYRLPCATPRCAYTSLSLVLYVQNIRS